MGLLSRRGLAILHLEANYAPWSGGGTSMELNAINSSGLIAGVQGRQAMLFKPTIPNGTSGSIVPISPGGSITLSSPTDINANGRVFGVATPTSSRHAFVWTPDVPNGTAGTWLDLGTLPN